MDSGRITKEIYEISKKGSSYGLESTIALARAVKDPQNKLRFVHIAGTNGKGSVLSYVSSVLTCSGCKTGVYTSPTVMSYYERIQIDGREISPDDYLRLAEYLLDICKKNKLSPTIFELETVMAFLWFAENNCDIVVLEAGLGGSLDATNIIETPEVCVITSIAKEHTQILGNTISEIAAAKAGIIKPNTPICVGQVDKEAYEVILKTALEKKSPVYSVQPEQVDVKAFDLSGSIFDYKKYKNVEISLLGRHQLINAALALEVINVLKSKGFNTDGLKEGMKRAYMPGRMEVVRKKPLFICDGAHNPQGAASLRKTMEDYLGGKKLIAIIGILKDKDYKSIINEILSLAKSVYAVSTTGERGLEGKAIEKIVRERGIPCTLCTSTEAAELALNEAKEDEVILACGSFTYLGEVISYGKSKQNIK